MVKKYSHRILFILVFLIIWEITARFGIVNKALLPSLKAILDELIKEILNGKLIMAVFNSFTVIIKGLIISLIFTFVLVLISMINEKLDDLIEFIISIAHPIPGVAILPLVILWFGIGKEAILFIIVHSMLWPLLINIKTEIKRLKNKYFKIAKVFKFSLLSEVINIYLYGSVPAIISGSKIAWSRGWRAYISSEMIFGVVGFKSGLGWYLFEQRVYMNTPALYSGIIAIILCGILVEESLFNRLVKMTEIRWKVL